MISTVASSAAAVAVTVLVALEVVAVYAVTPELNAGERLSDPIVSPERVAFKGGN